MAGIKKLLLVCGEASGDLHAAHLVHHIKSLRPEVEIAAVGGELLAREGAEIFFPIKELSVIGLFDVIKKLPVFLSLKKTVLEKINSGQCDGLILVDFSGFNLRLAAAVNKRIPVIYYISPQVWASRPGRIRSIKKYISKMVVLFKFEEQFYKKHGINAEFVGHPLLDMVKPAIKKEALLSSIKLTPAKTTLALLPGSRTGEVQRMLPLMLAAARLLSNEFPVQTLIAKSTSVDWEIYKAAINSSAPEARIIEGKTYDCLEAADFAIVASGTATLEAAILGKPFVIVYTMGMLNYLLYRPQVKVPYIGMVNIVAGERIIPEFIQHQASPRRIAREIAGILGSQQEQIRIKESLSRLKSSLGDKGAGLRAAEAIVRHLESRLS